MAQTVVHHTYTSSPTGVAARVIWTITGIIEGLLVRRSNRSANMPNGSDAKE